MVIKISSSTITKGFMITSLCIALMLPVAAFAEETQGEPTSGTGEEAVLYSEQETPVAMPMEEQVMKTVENEEENSEPVMLEDSVVDLNIQASDDLKRNVMLTSVEEDGTASTSNQNIILYSVITALLAVIAVLGTVVYRKRQQ